MRVENSEEGEGGGRKRASLITHHARADYQTREVHTDYQTRGGRCTPIVKHAVDRRSFSLPSSHSHSSSPPWCLCVCVCVCVRTYSPPDTQTQHNKHKRA